MTSITMTTYTNPVWSGYLADPFVLRHNGEYFAYGTGSNMGDTTSDGGYIFPVLRSSDLTHWESIGGALRPPADGLTSYWAPEVAFRDGLFYLYYSAAKNGEPHRLRVAIAEQPQGPFTDTGSFLLPNEGFTIDAHPFRDPTDGRWYLFFAKDFLLGERVGTALAAASLADDMVSVTGSVTTILRASDDWQIYERRRSLYGRTWDAWHTLEGPFVVFKSGRYFCFYSGGNWMGETYGVGVAIAEHVLGPYAEPEAGPVVLRGVAGHVIGPGHNSVVIGPDEQTPYFVYHAWDTNCTTRQLCIDPLLWTKDGPRTAGPTWTPQAIPIHHTTTP